MAGSPSLHWARGGQVRGALRISCIRSPARQPRRVCRRTHDLLPLHRARLRDGGERDSAVRRRGGAGEGEDRLLLSGRDRRDGALRDRRAARRRERGREAAPPDGQAHRDDQRALRSGGPRPRARHPPGLHRGQAGGDARRLRRHAAALPRPVMGPIPAAEPVDRFYAVVRLIDRFWVWFFFKHVDVRRPEQLPPRGPVLLCINHPNNLIDSLLVGAVLPRKVHYLATAALFRNPLLARFLVALGVIPVYRKADDPDKMDRNMEMFAACDEAFGRGRLIAIYPEGATRAEAHVQRIKTGAARIALGYEAHVPGSLTFVPVGLSFEARKRFRGRVLVSFGEPVAVSS